MPHINCIKKADYWTNSRPPIATFKINSRIDGSQLAPFKTNANYFDPRLPRERSLTGNSCLKCTTNRYRIKTENDVSLSALGLANILRVPLQNRGDENLISRSFYYASYVMSRTVDSHFPDVCNKVLKCSRVQSAIKEAADEEFNELLEEEAGLMEEKELKVLERKHRSRAIDILQRMKSCISGSLLRIAGWVLYKLLSKILTTIQFHKGQIEALRRCRSSSANIPIVYLPLHRSHLDYILVSFILYMNNIKPPLVAAGDNLLIPFFGNLMRGLGAFFIKRRLDDSDGKKDHIYRAVLQSYMTENLKQGNSLEFFIEGGRSRSGKALTPKSGLLSVVADCILSGEVEDVFIVPVAISYEKLIDGSFVSEQLGKPKVAENFTLAARSIWSTLHSNFGSVRVDFCQPFSLKDYLHNASFNILNSHLIINNKIHDKSAHKLSDCVACSGVRKASSLQSLYGLDVVVSEDKRQTIEKLAEHVIYDAFNAMPLMSTQLVSFLLLTKHRKGTTLHQLGQSLNWLREECDRRNRELSIAGDSLDVIRTACGLLGKELVAIEKISMAWSSSDGMGAITENNNVKIVFLKPSIKLPHVLELQYYSNSCISVFLTDSVVVNALFAIINTQLESLTACGDNMESNITIDFNELVDKSVELCEILHNDFVFAPPCANIRDLIMDKIESYVIYGVLCEAVKNPSSDLQLRQRYRQFDFDEEEEDDGYVGFRNGFTKRELRLVLSDENKQTISFYRSVLSSYIESYWVAASALTQLIGVDSLDEKSFFNRMIDIAKQKQQKGLIFHEECIAAEPFKNAVKLFESWNVLNVRTNGSAVRHIGLNAEFKSIVTLNDVIARIEEFKN